MNTIEQERVAATALCARHGVKVVPYAGAWWLLGEGINRVLGELAGLRPSDLGRLPEMPRAGRPGAVCHE